MMWTPGHFIYLWMSSLESRLHSWGVGVPARSYQKLPTCGTTLPGRLRDLPAVGSFHSRLGCPLSTYYGVSRLVYVSAYGSFFFFFFHHVEVFYFAKMYKQYSHPHFMVSKHKTTDAFQTMLMFCESPTSLPRYPPSQSLQKSCRMFSLFASPCCCFI